MRDSKVTGPWSDNVMLRLSLNSTAETTAGLPSSPVPRISPVNRPKGIMPSDCEVTRCSTHSLAILRSLSPSATILLLTPVVVPAGFGKTAQPKDSADPFEMLGRSLSQFHKRIRHVPYVPSAGLSETHDIFLRRADAVIVVACEPDGGPGDATPKSVTPDESIAKQSDFAESVVDALDDSEDEAKRIPLVLVRFGDDDWRNDLIAYENVLQAEKYSPGVVKVVGQLLFGSAK